MFLNLLNTDQKEIFLELAFHIANIDKDFAEAEQLLIHVYRKEMNMPEDKYKIKELSFNTIFEKLATYSKQVKKYIFVEVMAIIFADSVYADEEKELLCALRNLIGIDETCEKEIQDAIINLNEAYKIIGNFVNG